MNANTIKRSAADFAAVESPQGPELLAKLMRASLRAGRVRRYFSLRRAWVRALAREGAR